MEEGVEDADICGGKGDSQAQVCHGEGKVGDLFHSRVYVKVWLIRFWVGFFGVGGHSGHSGWGGRGPLRAPSGQGQSHTKRQ